MQERLHWEMLCHRCNVIHIFNHYRHCGKAWWRPCT